MSLPIKTEFAGFVQAAFEKGDTNFSSKILEQENVSVLQRLYGALIRADLESFANQLSPEAEMKLYCPEKFKFIKRAIGRDEITKATVYNFSQVKEQETNLLSLVAQGNSIVVIGQEKGKFYETDESYDVQFVQRFTISNGMVKQIHQIVLFSE
ncbi:MAG: nuclear transport factor 2 family protein [Pyrinomonadaceae bacterium]|nr:nuclear transport factor 2 family protein [Pyrinomonadaceae bacterium]